MATPKQNYAQQFRAYAQDVEPNIPSNVRTYSIFNPDTGTWQRITNNFRSPIPVQGQTLIPTQTPGIMLRPRTPAQVPAQTPLVSSRMRSPVSRKQRAVPVQERVVEMPLPAIDAAAATILQSFPADARDVNLNPDLNYSFHSPFETFQQEIPKSNAYSPLQNPRKVASPDPQTPTSTPTQTPDNNDSFWNTPLGNLIYHHPANLQRLLLQKGYRTAKPYVARSNAALEEFDRQAKEKINEFVNPIKKKISDWDAGFINWLNN